MEAFKNKLYLKPAKYLLVWRRLFLISHNQTGKMVYMLSKSTLLSSVPVTLYTKKIKYHFTNKRKPNLFHQYSSQEIWSRIVQINPKSGDDVTTLIIFLFFNYKNILFKLPGLLTTSCSSVTELIIAARSLELANQLSASTQSSSSSSGPVKQNCSCQCNWVT